MHGCWHVLATVNSATAIWRCRCVLHILISFPLDTPSVERLPAHMGVLFLTFVGFPRCFLHWFIFPPAVCWGSFLLTSLLAPVVFCLWNSHSHLGFQLHFTDDQRERIFFFSVPGGQLDIFSWEMSTWVDTYFIFVGILLVRFCFRFIYLAIEFQSSLLPWIRLR